MGFCHGKELIHVLVFIYLNTKAIQLSNKPNISHQVILGSQSSDFREFRSNDLSNRVNISIYHQFWALILQTVKYYLCMQ